MKPTIFVILALLFTACGGDEESTKSGGELFEELFIADCEALADCGALNGFTVQQCIDLKTSAACTEVPDVCGEEYAIPSTEWDACLDAMGERDCNSVVVGLLPSACLTIDELF